MRVGLFTKSILIFHLTLKTFCDMKIQIYNCKGQLLLFGSND